LEKEKKAVDSKIDKDLPSKLDSLLKDGSLDKETEILKILEDLSEKLSTLKTKENTFTPQIKEKEPSKTRLNKKWGRDPFADCEQ
jgi:hypothetical protein